MKKQDQERRARKTLDAARKALFELENSVPEMKRAAKVIAQRNGDIIVTGIGKSGFVGQKIAATLTSLGHRASFLHPVEAIHGDIGALSEGDVLLALSFSGESKEVVKITSYAKKNFGVSVLSFTESKKSSLGRLSDCCIEVKIKEEGSPNNMAPMASTTAMLVLGDMLTSMLTKNSFNRDHFARFHPGGSLGLKLKKIKDLMRKDFPLISEIDEFSKILKEINKKKLGATGIVDKKGKLIGIITDGDIRRFLISKRNIRDVKAGDIMTRDPKHVREVDSLESALIIMEKFKITHLFAVNRWMRPIGVIHIHDIVENTIIQ